MQNEQKHTPGWTSSEQKGLPRHCFMAQVFDANGDALASVEPTDPPSLASERARLIAAAPEMLGALRWYEEQARNCRKLGGVPEGHAARAALDADGGKLALAAISKAEGHSNAE